MDALHEAMKMNALFTPDRQLLVEQVHQPGLAAPNATPEVQTLHELWLIPAQPSQQGSLTLLLQIVPKAVERLN